jgi:hypothetical protein
VSFLGDWHDSLGGRIAFIAQNLSYSIWHEFRGICIARRGTKIEILA